MELLCQCDYRCLFDIQRYYEWQTSKDGKKLPYFIYFSENSDTYKCLTAESINSGSEIKTVKPDTKDDNKDGTDGMNSSKADIPHEETSNMNNFHHSNLGNGMIAPLSFLPIRHHPTLFYIFQNECIISQNIPYF